MLRRLYKDQPEAFAFTPANQAWASAAIISLALLAACTSESFWEMQTSAEGRWAQGFAALGCEQPVENLPERIAKTPQFAGQSAVSRLSDTRAGTAERADYELLVAQSYLGRAVQEGIVQLSEDGSRARLLVGACSG